MLESESKVLNLGNHSPHQNYLKKGHPSIYDP